MRCVPTFIRVATAATKCLDVGSVVRSCCSEAREGDRLRWEARLTTRWTSRAQAEVSYLLTSSK